MIPILNLTRQYEQLKAELEPLVCEIMASGYYVLGPNHNAFEEEMAQFLGVNHTIGCANGSDALYLALRALGIGAGDEVITTPFSYIATSESIARCGATPVFCDIDPKTLNMNPDLLEGLITSNTKAILPVHIFGQPADMDSIMATAKKHNIYVVEDCAQSIGATYKGKQTGSFGDIGCFSFFPTKNLGAFGDGGLLSTGSPEHTDRLKTLRVHGAQTRYYHDIAGINSRLDELQAAILRVKLPYLKGWTENRQAIAASYTKGFEGLEEYLEVPTIAEDVTHVFHQYTLRLKTEDGKQRDALVEKLKENGVGAMIYYPLPLYSQGTHSHLNLNPADYPECELASKQVFSLPMFPELTQDEQKQVIETVRQTVESTMKASVLTA